MTKSKERYRFPVVRIKLVKGASLVREEPIHNSSDVVELMRNEFKDYDREFFCVINIDAKGNPLNLNIVSIGDLTSSLTHPREVFKSSILANAGSIILFHNHPSGDPTPSQVDIETTKRLVEAGEILGIPVIDHIVIGARNGDYKSMRAMGVMEEKNSYKAKSRADDWVR